MEIFKLMGTILVDSSEAQKSISKTGDEADKAHSKLANGVATAGKWAAGIAAAAAAAVAAIGAFAKGIYNAAQETADFGSRIVDMSAKIGISAKSYQEWDYVLGMTGASVDSLKNGMKTLSQQAQANSDSFQKLGISQEEVATLSQEDLFGKVVTGLQGMEAGTERTALGAQLLGKSYSELGGVLNMSAEELAAMKKEAEDYGLIMSDEALAASDAFGDSTDRLSRTFTGLKNRMMGEFLPSLTQVTDGLAKLFTGDYSGLDSIKEGIGDFVNKLTEAIPKVLEVGGGIVTALVTAILENLPQLMSAATDLLMTIEMYIIQNLPLLLQTGLQLILTLVNGIVQALPELIPAMVDAILQIVDTLTDPNNLMALLDAAIAIILALANGLMESIPTLLEKAPEIIMNLLTAVIEAAPALLEGGAKLLQTIIEGIVGIFGDLVDKGEEIVDKLKEGIDGAVDKVKKAGKKIISSLWDGLKEAWSDVKTWFDDKIQWVKDAWNTINIFKSKSDTDGSNAAGLAYVPFDGYTAELHKGETILNADNTRNLVSDIINGVAGVMGGGSGGTYVINVQLDKKTIATTVFDPLRDVARQRGVAFG